MIGSIVYILCALTCWACAGLLLRAYARQQIQLLFWSGTAFCAFGISNLLLIIDMVVVPHADLALLRNAVTLAGICLLLRGLIWEGSSQ